MLSTTILQNCDNHISISHPKALYNLSVHITPITKADKIPGDAQALLTDKKAVKFPLAYYLIQEEDIKVIYSRNFDEKIFSQLFLEVSGTKYYKLFVNPDLDNTYSFLKNAYRYIGPDDTEFYASFISAPKTMVIWNKKTNAKVPFIVKMNIDEKNLNADSMRVPADTYLSPETIQMVFRRTLQGTQEPISGQQVSKIPESNSL